MSMETIHIMMIHAAHCYIPPLFGDVINTMMVMMVTMDGTTEGDDDGDGHKGNIRMLSSDCC